MQAIILAAGMGRRLGNLTKDNTKCMVKVDGISLIDRILTQLSKLTLSRVVIVIGYKGSNLKNYVGNEYNGLKIEYIENHMYDKTNNIYSLSLAKEKLQEEDTLLVESDLIFDDSLFPLIVNTPYPNLALVAKYETWMDGTMVRLDDDNNIINFISKKAFRYSDVDSYYKTVNIYKFSKEFSKNSYVPFLEAYTKALGLNEFYEQVLRVIALLEHCELKALPLNGQRWYEIDDIQDLDIAETIFVDTNIRLERYQKRYGGYWRFPSLIDYCYLVNPYFPPHRMREEMRSNFDSLLTEYPSGMSVNSMLMGKYFGIKSCYVCVGNGAAELIKGLMGYLSGKIGVVYPTFEEYQNRYERDCVVAYVPQNKNFSYTVSEIKEYFECRNISTLLLINPDNPSGHFVKKDDLLFLIAWAEECKIRLVVDESFVDFAEEGLKSSLLINDILERYSNLVVVKSISKSYGVPGLRLGVLASSDVDLIKNIRGTVTIWNVNSFAEFYLQIFGKYVTDYKIACSKFVLERNRFYEELQTIPYLRVIPSQANYFLCEVCCQYTSIELTQQLLEYNILVKDCSTKMGFEGGDYIRIAIRDESSNSKLLYALKMLCK